MSLEKPLPTRDARTLMGVPDGFNRFWMPYRMTYIHGEGKPSDSSDVEYSSCATPTEPDEEGLIVYRSQSCFVIMNLPPYNSDHLPVCPYRHVFYYTDLDEEECIEFGELTT